MTVERQAEALREARRLAKEASVRPSPVGVLLRSMNACSIAADMEQWRRSEYKKLSPEAEATVWWQAQTLRSWAAQTQESVSAKGVIAKTGLRVVVDLRALARKRAGVPLRATAWKALLARAVVFWKSC